MVLLCITVPMFTACRTTIAHVVEVSGVPNVRDLYIRNAGTASWGANLAGVINDIDVSRFPGNVDIRVVGTDGVVHSRYNIPFASAFVYTDSRSESNAVGDTLGILALLGGLVGLIALLWVLAPAEYNVGGW